jgi:CubicO group peptidase (beta-lactamase class C family)
MVRNIDIHVSDELSTYRARLEELPPGATPSSLFSFRGKHYDLPASDATLVKILDILSVLYPGAVCSTTPLPQRVSQANAHLDSISERVSQASGFVGLTSVAADLGSKKSAWLASDKAYLADHKRSFAEKYLAKQAANPAHLKDYLLHATHKKSAIADFTSCFDEACSSKDPQLLLPLLDHVSETELRNIIEAEELDIPLRQGITPNNFTFTEEALEELDAYIHDPDTEFSGVITLQDAALTHTVASKGINLETPFAIHSIGKVFTGMLALELVRKKILPEDVLNEPVQLSKEVLKALPESVRTHLTEHQPPITLKQLMLHQSGLGDYLPNYTAAITQAVLAHKIPTGMSRPESFLPYAEATIFPEGEEPYSNLGLLLVGLSLQDRTKTPFDDLLQTHILDPAGIKSFSSKKPNVARSNPEDPIAEYICGSPAGGYWTTAEDLCRFGTWTSSQWKDPDFLRLVKEYGGEFYSADEIHHSGGISSSSAYLSVFPEHQVTIAIVSDKKHPGAIEMNDIIRDHMLHRVV